MNAIALSAPLQLPSIINKRAKERSFHIPFSKSPHFKLMGPTAGERPSVEHYIHNKFAKTYNADLAHYLPSLLTLNCNNSLSAAVGLRRAESDELFLEQYLGQAIEKELASIFNTTVERHRIVELGNLVATWRGSSQLLFIFLTHMLHRTNTQWVVFTATAEVRKLLNKLHFTPFVLCQASAEHLGKKSASWGNYYDATPVVMVGHLPSAIKIMQQHQTFKKMNTFFSNNIADVVCEWNKVLA